MGPTEWVSRRKAEVILALQIHCHLRPCGVVSSGVSYISLELRGDFVRVAATWKGQATGCPLWPCPLAYPLMSFFCPLNLRETKVKHRSWLVVAESTGKLCGPMNKVDSYRKKGVQQMLDLPQQYSPVWRRKKKARNQVAWAAALKARGQVW